MKEGNFGRKGALGAESTPDPNTRPIHHLMPVTTRKLRSRYFGPNQELHERRLFCLIFVFNVFELIKTDMKIILHIQYQNLDYWSSRSNFSVSSLPHVKMLQPIKYHRMTIAGNGGPRQARDQGSNYQRGKATPADTVAGKCLKTA